jgi:Cu/Ag efflux pump CusA
VNGRDIASAAADVERRLKEIEFPLEYRAELLRSSSERVAARNRAIGAAVTAAIGIFLVLQACVGSWTLAAVIFLTLPAAVAGGLLAALATGGSISLGVVLGVVGLLGIVIRNGLTLIRHYRCLALAGTDNQAAINGSPARSTYESRRIEPASSEDAAIFAPGIVQRGTWDRFTAILMTAVVTAAAVLPLLLMGNVPGNEVLSSMAAVILGGLVTTTLYSLFCIPAMYLLFTPSRAAELEDLQVSLIGEQELQESISAARASEKEAQQTSVTN